MSRLSGVARFFLGGIAGALLGLFLAAVWWLRLNDRTCVGGPCDGTPPGDITLVLGGFLGTILGLLAVLLTRLHASRR